VYDTVENESLVKAFEAEWIEDRVHSAWFLHGGDPVFVGIIKGNSPEFAAHMTRVL